MISLHTAVEECLNKPEFVFHYNRLRGTSIGTPDKRSPIEVMIDKASGYTAVADKREKEMLEFIEFVDQYVWAPVLAQAMGWRKA